MTKPASDEEPDWRTDPRYLIHNAEHRQPVQDCPWCITAADIFAVPKPKFVRGSYARPAQAESHPRVHAQEATQGGRDARPPAPSPPVICFICCEVATYSTEAGRREIEISGCCEPCFDRLFAEAD